MMLMFYEMGFLFIRSFIKYTLSSRPVLFLIELILCLSLCPSIVGKLSLSICEMRLMLSYERSSFCGVMSKSVRTA